MTETPEATYWWRRFRSLPVCRGCWARRYPDREPAAMTSSVEGDCIVCEEPTSDGIFVRMHVEWR